jgi:hypothetical protein
LTYQKRELNSNTAAMGDKRQVTDPPMSPPQRDTPPINNRTFKIMKHTPRISLPILFLMWLFGSYGSAAFAGNKLTICHIPPGNPDNAHSITISASALPAHMAHGDSLGECGSDDSPTYVSFTAASFMLCDDRAGETGRSVNVSLTGNINTVRLECD